MTVKESHDQLNESLMRFHLNPKIEILDANNNPPAKKNTLRANENKKFHGIYSIFDGCSFKWVSENQEISGSLNLLSLKEAISDQWQDMVSEVIDSSQKINGFRVFDFYSNQNYVGFFIDDYPSKNGLFYVRELEAYKLNLDMESYFILAVEAMGLLHWPSLIIHWEYGLPLSESMNIEGQLVGEILDFDLEKFRELYMRLKRI